MSRRNTRRKQLTKKEVRPFINRCTRSYKRQQKNALNSFVGSLVRSGVWHFLDVLYIPAWAQIQRDAVLNLKSLRFSVSGVNSPTYTPKRGFFTGLSSSAAWSTNFVSSTEAAANSNYQLNNCYQARFVLDDGSTTGSDLGAASNAGNIRVLLTPRSGGTVMNFRINAGASSTTVTGTTGTRWLAIARTASTQSRGYVETTIEDFANNSSFLADQSFYLGCYAGAAGTPTSNCDRTIGAYCLGSFLDGPQNSRLRLGIYRLMNSSAVPY